MITNQMKTVLLMTSTIKPFDGMPHNQRSDPAVRMQDYRTAISSYLSLPKGMPDEIVFVDNSGHSLNDLEDLVSIAVQYGRKLSLHSITPSMKDCKSKPFGELDIQDQAHRDVLGSDTYSHSIIWKVTGRLFVPNIQEMSASLPPRSQLYCDLRKVPLIGQALGGNPWFDMRIWAYTPTFYAEHLLDIKNRIPSIDEGNLFAYVETLLPEVKGISPRFKIQPEFSGRCAANNQDYTSPSVVLKSRLRSVTRKLAPFIWL